MNINDVLSDEDIEECLDGTSDIKWIRELINLSQNDNLIDEESFADIFAYELQKFVDAEEGTEEFQEASQNNWDWGHSIAQNINDTIASKWID